MEKKFGYFSILQGQPMNFPLSDVAKERRDTYTKAEVDALIKYAIDEARKIDEASMAKHNRDASVISMILGFIASGTVFGWNSPIVGNYSTFYGH